MTVSPPEILVSEFSTVIMVIAVAVAFWRGRTERRKSAIEVQQDTVRGIFEQISECFAREGFAFEFNLEFGKFNGATKPTSTGLFITIEQYVGCDCIIRLEQKLNGAMTSFDQQARRAIHQRIDTALVDNHRSEHSRYMSRQHLVSLEKLGIESVVADLVALSNEYDGIWTILEHQGVREKISAALMRCADNNTETMKIVDEMLK